MEKTLEDCRGASLRIQQSTNQHVCVRQQQARERAIWKDYNSVSQPPHYPHFIWKHSSFGGYPLVGCSAALLAAAQ